jgi:hypothetical protein
MSLSVAQIELGEANAYVAEHHRHSNPTVGHKFSLAAIADGEIVGVAIIGRPVARRLQDGWTLEVNRVCTTGHRNACSFLYGASWRAAKALGYLRAVTYTTDAETGASVRAAGWISTDSYGGSSWNVPSRPRDDKHPIVGRVRWEIRAALWAPDLAPRPVIPIPDQIPGQEAFDVAA